MSKEANFIKTELRDGVNIIHLHSSFYTSNKVAQSLKELFLNLFNTNQLKVVVNMSQVQSIDSEGLGVLTNAYRHCVSVGGNLLLCEIASKDIYDVLEIVNIDKIIPIYQTQKEALKALIEGE